MVALSSYTPIATHTIASAVSTYTFSSISGSYTDLVLVVNAKSTSGGVDVSMRFNGDTASNYSKTNLYGDAGGAASTRQSNQTQGNINLAGYITTSFGPYQIVNIMNYANTTTYKTYLSRAGNVSVGVDAIVGTWRKTPEAITSITLFVSGDTFAVGSTFSLYGIANNTAGAKATGGVISSDSEYFYHSFYATGTFTPTQSLSCDYLVVAGGGGGSTGDAGGGGAGGYRTSISGSPLSVTATGYTITVGAGGSAGTWSGSALTAATNGGDSTFSTITSTGGGRGGSLVDGANKNAGGNGGSGGGGGRPGNSVDAGTGNTPSTTPSQGNNGGAGTGASNYFGGGGGGSSSAGSSNTAGAGTANAINGTSTTYAVGGSGGSAVASAAVGASGTTNRGNGGSGGSGYSAGGAGGSGVVIIRYAR